MAEPILKLTDGAIERIKGLIDKADNSPLGVRVGVETQGCSGMAYKVDYVTEVNPGDELIEQGGIKVFIDPAAVMFLIGSVMDYKEDKFMSGFEFKNPNEESRCGCGESFQFKAPAKKM